MKEMRLTRPRKQRSDEGPRPTPGKAAMSGQVVEKVPRRLVSMIDNGRQEPWMLSSGTRVLSANEVLLNTTSY